MPPAGRDHRSPERWLDGRDCGGGPGTGGGLLRSEVGSEMEVCLGRNSQVLPASDCSLPGGGVPMTENGVVFAFGRC